MEKSNQTSVDVSNELLMLEDRRISEQTKLDIVNEKKYAEIDIIEKKWEDEVDTHSEKVSSLKKEIREKKELKKELETQEEWGLARSKQQIDEFYLNSMVKVCDIYISYDGDITHKQTLKNEIDIWMIKGGYPEFKFYLAFYKDKLVGTSYRIVSQHAGDETVPYSFIGQLDDTLKVEEVIREKTLKRKATFQQWVRELKTIKIDEAVLMEMDKTTLETISNKIGKWY